MGGSTRAAGVSLVCRMRIRILSAYPRSLKMPVPRREARMFTGIVEELGEVVLIEDLGDAARLTVRGAQVTSDVSGGDSIAVNGVCLTVTSAAGEEFTADVMRETLTRSRLGGLAAGRPARRLPGPGSRGRRG